MKSAESRIEEISACRPFVLCTTSPRCIIRQGESKPICNITCTQQGRNCFKCLFAKKIYKHAHTTLINLCILKANFDMVVFNRNFDPDAASGTGVGERVGRGTKSLVLLGHTKKELDPSPLHRSARGKEKDGNRRRRSFFERGKKKRTVWGMGGCARLHLGPPHSGRKEERKGKGGRGGGRLLMRRGGSPRGPRMNGLDSEGNPRHDTYPNRSFDSGWRGL